MEKEIVSGIRTFRLTTLTGEGYSLENALQIPQRAPQPASPSSRAFGSSPLAAALLLPLSQDEFSPPPFRQSAPVVGRSNAGFLSPPLPAGAESGGCGSGERGGLSLGPTVGTGGKRELL